MVNFLIHKGAKVSHFSSTRRDPLCAYNYLGEGPVEVFGFKTAQLCLAQCQISIASGATSMMNHLNVTKERTNEYTDMRIEIPI